MGWNELPSDVGGEVFRRVVEHLRHSLRRLNHKRPTKDRIKINEVFATIRLVCHSFCDSFSLAQPSSLSRWRLDKASHEARPPSWLRLYTSIEEIDLTLGKEMSPDDMKKHVEDLKLLPRLRRVCVEFGRGSNIDISHIECLAPLSPLVTTMDAYLDRGSLEALSSCLTAIKEITIQHKEKTVDSLPEWIQGLTCLSRLSALQHLEIKDDQHTSWDDNAIFTAITAAHQLKLRSLKLLATHMHNKFQHAEVPIDPAALVSLSCSMPSLVRLELPACYHANKATLEAFAPLTTLRVLSMQGFDGGGLSVLKPLMHLVALSLGDAPDLTTRDIAALQAALPKLEHLQIMSFFRISDAALVSLELLTHLTVLHTVRHKYMFDIHWNTDVTDDGLECIAQLHNLRDLRLGSVPAVGDVGAAHLASLLNLQRLAFSDSAITDRGMEALSLCTSLRLISIPRSRNVTNAGIGALKALPLLEALDIEGLALTEDVIPFLGEMPSLRYLKYRQAWGKGGGGFDESFHERLHEFATSTGLLFPTWNTVFFGHPGMCECGTLHSFMINESNGFSDRQINRQAQHYAPLFSLE